MKRVEYLESTGTQFIDTGVVPNNTQEYYIEYSVNNITDNMVLMGSRSSGTYATSYDQVYINFNSNAFTQSVYREIYYLGTVYNLLGTPQVGTKYQVTYNYTSFSGNYNNNSTKNLYLFALNNIGAAAAIFKGKIYSCKIYDNGTLIRDYIPILDDNDVPCLLDQVNNVKYYNQGSGTFNYGSVIEGSAYIGVNSVAQKIKKMYIGVGGVARKVKKAYIGVNGIARQFYSAPTASYTYEDFTSNIVPKSWTTTVEYNKAEATNTYGTWKIESDCTLYSGSRVAYGFNNSTTNWVAATNGESEMNNVLEFPEGVAIKPAYVYIRYNATGSGSNVQGLNAETNEWEVLTTVSATTSVKYQSLACTTNDHYYSKLKIHLTAQGQQRHYEFQIPSGTLRKEG